MRGTVRRPQRSDKPPAEIGKVPANDHQYVHYPAMEFDPTFIYGNYIEACLWAGMGVIAVVKRNSVWSVGLGCALVAFGVSDVAETQTGAWYEPWWLLLWKAVCVVLILWFGLLVLAVRRRKGIGIHHEETKCTKAHEKTFR